MANPDDKCVSPPGHRAEGVSYLGGLPSISVFGRSRGSHTSPLTHGGVPVARVHISVWAQTTRGTLFAMARQYASLNTAKSILRVSSLPVLWYVPCSEGEEGTTLMMIKPQPANRLNPPNLRSWKSVCSLPTYGQTHASLSSTGTRHNKVGTCLNGTLTTWREWFWKHHSSSHPPSRLVRILVTPRGARLRAVNVSAETIHQGTRHARPGHGTTPRQTPAPPAAGSPAATISEPRQLRTSPTTAAAGLDADLRGIRAASRSTAVRRDSRCPALSFPQRSDVRLRSFLLVEATTTRFPSAGSESDRLVARTHQEGEISDALCSASAPLVAL